MRVTILFEIPEDIFDAKAVEVDRKSGAEIGINDCISDLLEAFFKSREICDFKLITN